MDFGFDVLSLIIAIPTIAGIVLLFMPAANRDIIRGVAITAAASLLALSLVVFLSYHNAVAMGTLMSGQPAFDASIGASTATRAFSESLVFEARYIWVEQLGIAWHVGVDGLSAPMVLLTGMVTVAGVLISWNIQDRIREFMAFFMLLVAGVLGVFVAVDLFMLFFFYELAIFPMYLLIAGWGWVQLREYASMKLTLYILIGSVVALVGAVAMYFYAGSYFTGEQGSAILQAAIESGLLPQGSTAYSFNLVQLTLAAENGIFNVGGYFGIDVLTFGTFWFPFIFIGFAVLAGVFPFHNWSPDGHVAAPTAVSMIHAGVLMKLGAFAALRVGVQLMPEGAQLHLPWIVFLTLINVVYGALIAFRQRDFKYVIGFSSVSHMGLVSMGFATMNITGMTGAGLQMFSHGAMTALFFGCVGMVYDRAHTRDIPSLGGFIKQMPWVGVAFIIGGLTSMGMPGFSGFVAEFPIFQGMWEASQNVTLQIGNFTLSNYYGPIVILAALGIVVTAAYVLRVTGQVFFGDFDAKRYPEVGNIAVTDRIILLLLGAPLLIVGLYPQIMAPMISQGVSPIIMLLGGM
ncbi:NADH-quinone oxidoreductase subunit M [Phototrophicus methaneseepsis]|uniref:NADH-quinone oxidoreductase subunit M n=1 Tax=Phototrophicus methaneseepsis TaxID=2710758 RepID=A0A7S8E7N9_9CHLR|nr:NADH-quinone oxidoreductase subunit M [Phototrophicus methaneseepsis]QPC81903.1 NADH-quinone oxidoreductase subunit M [Phototrophicus methaneseepsis]